MKIRKYKPGEELLLHEIFYTSIHENAVEFYSVEQLMAWAPTKFEKDKWIARIKRINPFVIILDNEIVGYADLQNDGYIDHFFIKGGHSGKGLGSIMLKKLIAEAVMKGVPHLTSTVSLAAQKLFLKFGFEIVKRQKVRICEVELENALMKKTVV